MSEPAGQAAVAVPRGARGARTRACLLEAARTSFATTGWSRARVEDVCRAAGVGHGTFCASFGNRTEILEALVRRHADALDAVEDSTWSAAVPAPRQAPELRRAVHRVLTGFFDVSRRDSDIREFWLSAAPGAMVEQAVAAVAQPVRGEPAAPTAAERLVEGRTDLWVHGVLR